MYEYPNDPADSNADEVEAWLKTNPPVEQRNEVLKAEASETGKNRKTVLAYASADPTPPADPGANPSDTPPGTAPEPGAQPSEAPPTVDPEQEQDKPAEPEQNPDMERVTSGLPVWQEETHGPIDPDKKDFYFFVPKDGAVPVG